MQLILAGPLDQAHRTLQRLSGARGWLVERLDDGVLRLTTPGAPAAAAAFLQLEPYGEETLLTTWLPAIGGADGEAIRDALESVALHEPAERSEELLRRLRRIEGQMRGLQRMVADNRECEAIMTQFAAVSAALKQAAAQLVADHLVDCIQRDLAAGADPAELLNQRLLRVLF